MLVPSRSHQAGIGHERGCCLRRGARKWRRVAAGGRRPQVGLDADQHSRRAGGEREVGVHVGAGEAVLDAGDAVGSRDRPQRDRAVLGGPVAADRRKRVGHEARIAVGVREAERRGRGECGQEAADALLGELAERSRGAGREGVAAAVRRPEREVYVTGGARLGGLRLGHERRRHAVARRDCANRLLRHEGGVGRVEGVVVVDVQLELADAVLEAQRLHGDTGVSESGRDCREQRQIDRRAECVVRIGAVVDGARRLEAARGEILHRLGEQVELELEAAAQAQAAPGELLEHALETGAGIDRHGIAARELPGAEHPGLAVQPRGDGGRFREQLEDDVGIAVARTRVPAVVAGGRLHPAAGDVEAEEALREGHAVALGRRDGGRGGQPLAAPDSQMIGCADVDVADLAVGQPRGQRVLTRRRRCSCPFPRR